jgi:NADH:ubiquinone oxidoreductase subunit 4 (subunit M)
VREAWFRDPGQLPPIRLDWPTRVLCVLLMAGILALGVMPAHVMDTISTAVAKATRVLPPGSDVVSGQVLK